MSEPHRGDPSRPDGPSPSRSGPTRPRSTADPRMAGFLLVATIVALTGVGLGIGALLSLPVPFALGGLFAGLVLGFVLVYSRFKDI
jgi:hypothetical protein